MECVVCGRPLKDPKAIAAGVGPKCAKKIKLTQQGLEVMGEIKAQGLDCEVKEKGTIQILLVSSGRDQKSQSEIKWKYPRGVK